MAQLDRPPDIASSLDLLPFLGERRPDPAPPVLIELQVLPPAGALAALLAGVPSE